MNGEKLQKQSQIEAEFQILQISRQNSKANEKD
jgi:hypothetical protein